MINGWHRKPTKEDDFFHIEVFNFDGIIDQAFKVK